MKHAEDFDAFGPVRRALPFHIAYTAVCGFVAAHIVDWLQQQLRGSSDDDTVLYGASIMALLAVVVLYGVITVPIAIIFVVRKMSLLSVLLLSGATAEVYVISESFRVNVVHTFPFIAVAYHPDLDWWIFGIFVSDTLMASCMLPIPILEWLLFRSCAPLFEPYEG